MSLTTISYLQHTCHFKEITNSVVIIQNQNDEVHFTDSPGLRIRDFDGTMKDTQLSCLTIPKFTTATTMGTIPPRSLSKIYGQSPHFRNLQWNPLCFQMVPLFSLLPFYGRDAYGGMEAGREQNW